MVEDALSSREAGNAALKQSNYDLAFVHYNKAIELHETAAVFANRALLYLKMNRNTEAIRDCNKCIDLDEKYVKAWFRKALAYSNIGLMENALQCMQTVLSLDSGSVEARSKVAQWSKKVPSEKGVLVDQIDAFSPSFGSKSEFIPVQVVNIAPNTNDAAQHETPLPAVASTSGELLSHWKDVRQDKQTLAKYIKGISYWSYVDLFEHSLDADILSDIIDALSFMDDPCSVVCALCQVPATSLVTMFLSPNVFTKLYGILDQKSQNLTSEQRKLLADKFNYNK